MALAKFGPALADGVSPDDDGILQPIFGKGPTCGARKRGASSNEEGAEHAGGKPGKRKTKSKGVDCQVVLHHRLASVKALAVLAAVAGTGSKKTQQEMYTADQVPLLLVDQIVRRCMMILCFLQSQPRIWTR